MDLNNFIQEFRDGVEQLPNELLRLYTGAALNAKAIVQQRIQETGRDSKNATLHPYSKQYLAFKKGEANNPYVPGEKLPSNRYRGFTDFTLTGAMWNNINLKRTDSSDEGIKIVVGATSADNQQKVDHVSDLWEDIFLMRSEEEKNLALAFEEDLQASVNKLFDLK